jgi:hypothetical protein
MVVKYLGGSMKNFRNALVSSCVSRVVFSISALLLLAMTSIPIMASSHEKTKAADPSSVVNADLPILVVRSFAVAPDIAWPYTAAQVKAQMIASLKMKVGNKFNVVPEAPPGSGHDYVLQGEVTKWNAGNQAVHSFVGYGAGRESAAIHYWVTDPKGEKIFEHKDVIRESYFSGVSSVGELAHPLADKVAIRLRDAKIP